MDKHLVVSKLNMKWIHKNWAVIGGIIALATISYVLFIDPQLADIESLLWLHFALLLIHQFEEYVYPGGFKEFFQENIWKKNPIMRSPLNDNGILLVNVCLGWTAYFLSALCGTQVLWLAVGLVGVSILNGIMHSVMFFYKRKYNPGFLSGLFLFIPFGIFALSKLAIYMTTEQMASGLFVFVFGTALIPISIYITSQH